MRNDLFRDQHGFSLVELMVVIAMISILTAPLIYLEISFSERFYSSVSRRDMIEAGNRTLEWIARDVRTGTEIPESLSGTSPVSRLTIKNAEGTVIAYTFDPEKRHVIRRARSPKKNGDTDVMEMARNVDDFAIVSSSRAIRVTIDLSKPLFKSRETVSMTGIAARRIR